MRTKLNIILLAFATVSISLHAGTTPFPAPLPKFMNQEQLTKWRAERAAMAKTVSSTQETPTQFYTGKPYVADAGGYIFKYRTYNPEMSRWTSADPSGFPDGSNNQVYVSSPTESIDPTGLDTLTVTGYNNYETVTLTTGLTEPNVHSPGANNYWTSMTPSFQSMLDTLNAQSQSYLSGSVTSTFDTAAGTWGAPSDPLVTASHIAGGTALFTVDVNGSSTPTNATYTVSAGKIAPASATSISVVPGSSTPYNPITGQPASIQYNVQYTVSFYEATSVPGAPTEPGGLQSYNVNMIITVYE